jgi:hypothetical protein
MSRQKNASADTTTVSRDMNMDVRYCSPTADTRRFAVVLRDWRRLKFDGNGNLKALRIVETASKRGVFDVTVSGVLKKNMIEVGAISAIAVTAKK